MNIIKLFSYLKPYLLITVLGPLFMLLEVAVDLSQPWFMQRIIDIGITQNNLDFVLRNGILMLLLSFVGLTGGFMSVYFSTRASLNFATDLRRDLFVKVQSFSYANLDRLSTGPLITRLTDDINRIQGITIMILRMLFRAPFLLIGSIIMAAITAPELAPILIVILPILVIILYVIIKKNYPLFYQVQLCLDKLNTVIQENLAGVRVVKAFVRSDYETKKFTAANDRYMETTVYASRMVALSMPLLMLTINLGIVAVLWLGGVKLQAGGIQIGQIVAFINYLMQVMTSLMFVGMLILHISRAEASGKRVNEILGEKPEITDDPTAVSDLVIKGEVSFRNVNFSYNGSADNPVLKDISFVAKPGETIGILGATGSGKSSLINLIPRLYEADSGEILIDGRDIRSINHKVLLEQIGLVAQNTFLFSGSVKDNILYGNPQAEEDEITWAAQTAQADRFIRHLPVGYDSELKQRGVNLSGGQKQRISIARALVRKPAILILDDSTSAVDAKAEAQIQKAIKKKMNNTTCFIVAQKITSVLEADKIIVLDNGSIAAIGRHEELLTTSDIYREIYDSQLGEEEISYA